MVFYKGKRCYNTSRFLDICWFWCGFKLAPIALKDDSFWQCLKDYCQLVSIEGLVWKETFSSQNYTDWKKWNHISQRSNLDFSNCNVREKILKLFYLQKGSDMRNQEVALVFKDHFKSIWCRRELQECMSNYKLMAQYSTLRAFTLEKS